ncbi:winged helix DNA-binding protein [Sphingobacterium paramultivorum]|uniref:Winged helix DNA-binding protein n=1 Tax=Sphingobacterium paramultivorum TaxID=2886510 RepID=A0A7G5DZ33_9SPHI|nr:winged helix DNA-binding protein [Sphingobacterium paramultivorum]QMV67008.1 winged helix DNA-binding protein [Sphingobacterium paramultivorum]WSO15850.1 winged helix DNA-binding protein [Sphingobacterium paramultivorum]
MHKKEILKELVEHFFDFDDEFQGEKEYSMADFVGYLNVRYAVQTAAIRNIAGEEEEWIKEDDDVNTDISTLLVFMYRYAVVYFKKALKEGPINTLDEFSFLIVLMTYPSLSKTELVQKLIMEKTSGVEVIKRLLKNELIEEFDNPNDKRSVLVAITAKGKEELASLFPKMGLVGSVIVGNLTSAEVSSLSFLLRKLDYYHNDIFLHHRNLSLEELRDRKDL